MAYIEPNLAKLCQKDPKKPRKVVITLTEASQHLGGSDIDLADAEKIGDMGILKGTYTGKQILELSNRGEVEEITPDFEVRALS